MNKIGVISLVEKRYVKRGNKLHGPYYYKTVRNSKGEIKKIYLGKEDPVRKSPNYNSFIITLMILIVAINAFLWFNLAFSGTGHIILDINKTVSSEAILEINGLAQSIPVELSKDLNGEWVYDISSLELDLDPGQYNIRIIDNDIIIHEEEINIEKLIDTTLEKDNTNTSIEITEAPITEIKEEGERAISKVTVEEPVVISKTIKAENALLIEIDVPEEAQVLKVNNIEGNQKIEKIFDEVEPLFSNGNKTVIVEADDNNETMEVQFIVPGPNLVEENITETEKEITISSDYHFKNITAFSSIPETKKEDINLYWKVNGTKQKVKDITYYDENNNNLIEKIEWIVPHLSNQTYVIEITVLNIQSYPVVGETWVVNFNTTGTANLTITPRNGTTWSEYFSDLPSTTDDLTFKNLTCGSTELNNDLTAILDTGSEIPYNVISPSDILRVKSLKYTDYSCNKTASLTNKVLTLGKHHLTFEFGGTNITGSTSEAHNFAACGTILSSDALTQDIVTTGTCLTIGSNNILIDGAGFSMTSDGTGVGINNPNGFNNVTIKNFKNITNFNIGINFTSSSNSTIWNNTIINSNVNFGRGIQVYNSDKINISNNHINTSTSSGNVGILSRYSKDLTIKSNNINAFGSGGQTILFTEVNDSLVKDNIVSSTQSTTISTGTSLLGGFNLNISFENNTITGSSNNFDAGLSIDTCDNCTAIENNIIFTGSDGSGIYTYLSGGYETGSKSYTKLINNTINTTGITTPGILIEDSLDTFVDSNTIITSAIDAYGIYIFSFAENSTLLNNNITATNTYEIFDDTGTGILNYLIYNNSFGEIKWTSTSFLENLTLNGGISTNNGINLGNNSIGINNSIFDAKINTSATIKLYGLNLSNVGKIYKWTTFSNETSQILINGNNCLGTTCTSPVYTSNNLVFNTASFSSFAAAEGISCGDTIGIPTTLTAYDPVAYLQCNGTALDIISDNIALDCNGQTLSGNGTTMYPTTPILNVYSTENTTITNCTFQNAMLGVKVQSSRNFLFLDNVIKNIMGLNDPTNIENAIGLYLRITNNSIIERNTFNNFTTQSPLFDGNLNMIHLYGQSYNTTIKDNHISNSTYTTGGTNSRTITGIQSDGQDIKYNLTIKDNTFENLRCESILCNSIFGITFITSHESTRVIDNNFTNNDGGILLAYDVKGNFSNNRFVNTTTYAFSLGYNYLGLAMPISNVSIKNNEIINTTTAFFIYNGTDLRIANNSLTNVPNAAFIDGYSNNVSFLSPILFKDIYINQNSNITFNNLVLGNSSLSFANFTNIVTTINSIINTTLDVIANNDTFYLDTSTGSGLNFPANITFLQKSYSNLANYSVLKNVGLYCTTCTNLLSNPVKFSVTQFDNLYYTITSIPEINSLKLNSTTNNKYTTENLTLWTTTSDPDGNGVKSIINWYKNGESLLLLNLPMDGGALANGKGKDYSLYGQNVTSLNSIYLPNGGFDGKGAVQFTGQDPSELWAPNNTDFSNIYELSMEAWVKPNGTNINDTTIIRLENSTNIFASLGYFRTRVTPSFGVINNSMAVSVANATSQIPSDTWSHIVGTWKSGENTAIYVNGVDVTDTTSNITGPIPNTGNINITIGGNINGLATFNGTIDEVRIWKVALTPEQVMLLYKNKTNIIDSSMTSVGEVWNTKITPNNNKADGNLQISNSITIANIPSISTPVSSGGGNHGMIKGIKGCTDANANNYNSKATINDGSCTYDLPQLIPKPIPEIVPIVPPIKIPTPTFDENPIIVSGKIRGNTITIAHRGGHTIAVTYKTIRVNGKDIIIPSLDIELNPKKLALEVKKVQLKHLFWFDYLLMILVLAIFIIMAFTLMERKENLSTIGFKLPKRTPKVRRTIKENLVNLFPKKKIKHIPSKKPYYSVLLSKAKKANRFRSKEHLKREYKSLREAYNLFKDKLTFEEKKEIHKRILKIYYKLNK